MAGIKNKECSNMDYNTGYKLREVACLGKGSGLFQKPTRVGWWWHPL